MEDVNKNIQQLWEMLIFNQWLRQFIKTRY